MKYSEMRPGRMFVLSLDPGEMIREEIERFSLEHGVVYGTVSVVGGVDGGSVLVVGPKVPADERIEPLKFEIDAPSEVTGFGTIFPDESGKPTFHMHGSIGREGRSVTGCFREGVIAWLVTEVVITEMKGSGPIRKKDKKTGYGLLTVE
ncbi:MAG: DNA-binding protein [Candidatus Methanomethylophilaceae archaeon]|nr:DNA-binding protein [Candidatus Methanomethylophilaceae archaeon]NCA73247.1 DNA-binding protein [Gammaproteobacteria bacterium]MDD2936171.1 DNA-binding protein [Candidatus Methanomethylophilaceae archaeon]MDD3350897.1 DNA-binding protein [Candidatus Methanomethylophilaceae archaeon]MDD3986615.1 DNA-binding protein [Candidatus Methanomethylophilaceae archaeon]